MPGGKGLLTNNKSVTIWVSRCLPFGEDLYRMASFLCTEACEAKAPATKLNAYDK